MSEITLFISHASSDDALISQIHAQLEAAGVNVWVDHEDGINPGDNFSKEIQDAINGCKAGLFVMSAASVKSSWCEAEWQRILRLGKRLYLALAGDVPIADIPVRLETIHYVDLRSDFAAGMAELTRAVQGDRALDPRSKSTGQGQRISGNFPRWQLDLPMIGRDEALAETQKWLNGGARATTILGFGGLGKTRLAAEIVATSEFRGGVIWHEIRDYTRLTNLTELARDHLHLPPTTADKDVWAVLGQAGTLLVLDNAEDCVEPELYAEQLNNLDTGFGTRVLMTSRRQWTEVRGAQKVDLRALAIKDAAAVLRTMAAYEPPDYPLDGHEEHIAEAAKGHPRLMWYAVHWANDAPAEKVLEMLRTLQGRDPDEALEDLVGKTLKRMRQGEGGEKAEAALRRLAVCRGGFTEAAAAAIAGESESLRPLKRWGLVSFEGGRYSLDAMVTQYTGTDENAQRPHYDYYHALAKEHHDKQDYLGLDVESDNLTAAFEWAMAEAAYEDALWLSNACGYFLANRGRFEQRLNWSRQVAEALKDHPDKLLWANAQNSLGVRYNETPTGDRADNLRRAIAAYESALVYRTAEAAPQSYAMTQNNLGIAYIDLAEIEEREGNLRRAIAAYEAALEYRTAEAAPQSYAMTQNNLGTAYAELSGIEDREGNLRRAIAAFEAALVYRTAEAAPQSYATTQNNLGAAYQTLAAIEDRESNLKRAIAAYEAALEYRTAEAAPLAYAQTQNNLGNAYRDLSKIEDREDNLRRAIAAYEAALVYRTAQAAPQSYAMTQYNLGLLYKNMGDKAKAVGCWREAERYYRQMGMVRDADEVAGWLGELE